MRMIFAWFACLGMLPALRAQEPAGYVHIQGKLIHFDNGTELRDVSEYEYLLPPDGSRVIHADSAGMFSIRIPLKAPNYFKLGRNNLYLSPGDDLEVVIDKLNPLGASFSGRGAAANRYLRETPYPHSGSFLKGNHANVVDPETTIAVVNAAVAARRKMLDTLREVSAAFKRLEYARINADALNSFVRAPDFLGTDNSDTIAACVNSLNKLAGPAIAGYSKGMLDASLLKLVVYREMTEEWLKLKGPEKDRQIILDWNKASAMVEEWRNVNDKDSLRAFRKRIDAMPTPGYRQALISSLNNLLKFGRGDMAADFTATGADGRPVRLSSLKGKVIYVDIWATWCGPCMAEMPHFEALKAQFKDNPDYAFVSLSIDDDARLWMRSVQGRGVGGYQWMINRNQLQAYNIIEVPRVLLIDRQFRIVDLSAELPSSKTIQGRIESLH